MRKLYLAVVVSPLLLVSSCASVDSQGCARVSATLVAKDANKGGSNPGGTTKISIKPDTVKVKPGCPFVINNPGGHEISTTPQNAAATWLIGSPTTGDLSLGPAAKTGGAVLFKYKIVVKDVGELDPRARVL